MKFLISLLLVVCANSSFANGVSDRIDFYSESFLGLPYVAGPLGEGPNGKVDKDPLIRFDAFDCTTYVETVMALAFAASDADDADLIYTLNQIRYSNGLPSFVTRNHFTSVDWNPHLEKLGIAKDITLDLYLGMSNIRQADIDKQAWFKKYHNVDVSIQKQTATMFYLPKKKILANPKILDRIPNASIINIVRENWLPKDFVTDLAVAHQGIAIRKNGVLMFRNASSRKSVMKVVEEPLVDFLKRVKDNDTWVGINILEIKD